MAYNKIVYGGNTLIDLTGDTAEPSKVLAGYTFHGKDGEPTTGTCTFDVDSQDATAAVAELLDGKTAYARGVKITGSMPNRGAMSGTISTKEGLYSIQQGYHDGSGKVSIDVTEQAKLIPDNIREGVTVLGVAGAMSGTEGAKPQSKEVTPTTADQTILPDAGFNYLSQVVVKAIPYAESTNTAGGTTVTIG